jgi:hypothetical protein
MERYKNFWRKHDFMDGRKGWKEATRWRNRKGLRSQGSVKGYTRADSKGSYWARRTTKCRNG